jgi:hypothetical protein
MLGYGSVMFESQSIENLDSATTARLLVDRAAIVDLTHRYCWALDTKDFEALDGVFDPDANGDLLEDVRGRDAIKARIRRALEPLEQTQHLVANHMVRVEGDRAWCRCYLQSQHVRKAAEGGPNFIIAGRYEDELKRTPDGWRIVFRKLTVMWTDGNPRVARG